MKLYKLTDENNQTRNNTQWGPNVTHTASGKGKLCSSGWIHAYTDPLLAVLLNPIHANFTNPHLWEAEGKIRIDDNGTKIGTTSLTTIKQIPLSQVSINQKACFAILCAKQVYKNKEWNNWANNWLDGKNRTKGAAEWAAKAPGWTAGRAAERAARMAARWAAWAARWAPWTAGRAAEWAAGRAAERTAEAAGRAAEAAGWAAGMAAEAVEAAGWAEEAAGGVAKALGWMARAVKKVVKKKPFNLKELAYKAIQMERS